jgi:hypothetical protein
MAAKSFKEDKTLINLATWYSACSVAYAVEKMWFDAVFCFALLLTMKLMEHWLNERERYLSENN